MPHPVTGDCRDDEDAAEAAFTDRMRAIYARIYEIDEQRHTLSEERKTLLREVRDSIGVAPGTILETRAGKVQVVRAEGVFEEAGFGEPGAPYRVWPAAKCSVAPATKNGFHERARLDFTHIDKGTYFMAQHGKPLAD
jgi:hypothetical protein